MINLRRFIAYMVDYIAIIVAYTILSSFIGGLEKYGVWAIIHFFLLIVIYFVVLYQTVGYSVGEKLLGLRVTPVGQDDSALELSSAVFRGGAICLYSVAPILALIALLPSKRSLADRISMTVLKIQPQK